MDGHNHIYGIIYGSSQCFRDEYYAMDYVRDMGCYNNGEHPSVSEGANRIWSVR